MAEGNTGRLTCGIYMGPGSTLSAERVDNHVESSSSGTNEAPKISTIFFDVPIPTRHFKGRTKTMEDIKDYFANLPPQTDDWWDRTVAIVGLGGMGKTETAYKLAAENKETFPNVAWINAETQEGALASFLGLAKELKLVEMHTKVAEVGPGLAQKVYQHIDQHDYGKVLFIFDNAIQLSPDGPEFGITDFLPTKVLRNRRFPYILITTQTDYWERGIKRFRVDELGEEESLEFFCSHFEVQSPECNEKFKKLHTILKGYPLAMNLVAAQIDYKPGKDKISNLKLQINNYIEKLEKDQNKILNAKKSRGSSTYYKKTLSNVWKLTFERIQQEDKGQDALELLQFMSYFHVPIDVRSIIRMSVTSTDCPHPTKEESVFRVKESIRFLERFYTVRILKVYRDDEVDFPCDLGMHRLVQFVVRQQMDSSKVFERILVCFARDFKSIEVNRSAVEETLRRSQLSLKVLPYVGILACHGSPAACTILETCQPETKAAATIRDLYFLERAMTFLKKKATQVLRELIELTQSEERLIDRHFFFEVTIQLLTMNYCKHKRENGTEAAGYFDLKSLDGTEELLAQIISSIYSIESLSCKSYNCNRRRSGRNVLVAILTAKLSKLFIRDDASNSTSTDGVIAEPKWARMKNFLAFLTATLSKVFVRDDASNSTSTDGVIAEPTVTVDAIADFWFAVFARVKYHDPERQKNFPNFLSFFWRDMYEAFHSPKASQSRSGVLKVCLWNRGLAKELIRHFGYLSLCASYSEMLILLMMDFSLDGMDLRDERVQEVIQSFCQMATIMETKISSIKCSGYDYLVFALELCSIWVKLFLMDDDPPSHNLLECLSRLKFLDWTERRLEFYDVFGRERYRFYLFLPTEYLSEYFPRFIQRFSSCNIQPIPRLFNVVRGFLEHNHDRKGKRN